MSVRGVACLLAIAVMFATRPAAANPTTIQILAYEFAPLQMRDGDGAKGYVVDLVKEMVEMVSTDMPLIAKPVRFLPWKRAMNTLEQQPNVMFFSLSRTPAREDKFLWVGEISPYKLYFFKLKKRADIEVGSIADIRKGKHVVGVPIGSNTEELLKGHGFRKDRDYITYSHYKRGIPMLFRERFTMLPLTSFVARANICREGFAGNDVEPALRLDSLSKPLWMVFSRGTSRSLVLRFQNALKHLTEDGTAERLRLRYLDDHQNRSCAGRAQ